MSDFLVECREFLEVLQGYILIVVLKELWRTVRFVDHLVLFETAHGHRQCTGGRSSKRAPKGSTEASVEQEHCGSKRVWELIFHTDELDLHTPQGFW